LLERLSIEKKSSVFSDVVLKEEDAAEEEEDVEKEEGFEKRKL